MTCPRCGNEWDVSKSPCGQCGLLVRLPGNMGASRKVSQSQKNTTSSSGSMPGVRPQARQGMPPASTRMPNMPSMPHAPQTPTPSAMPRKPMQEQNGQRHPLQGISPQTPQVQDSQSFSSSPGFPQQSTNFPSSPSNPPVPSPGSMPRSVRPTIPANTSMNNNGLSSSPGNGVPRNQVTARESRNGTVNTGGFSLGNVPPTPTPLTRSTDQLGMNTPASPLRPRRLVSEPTSYRPGTGTEWATGEQNNSNNQLLPTQGPQLQRAVPIEVTRTLTPGTMLRGGRYRLQELQQGQEWQPFMYETTWLAQDAQKGGAQVVLCEVGVPENNSMKTQSMLRSATIALTSAGRHPHIPTLWDVFSELGRNFFVFEPMEGESLIARMRRTGRAIPEQDVIECCLQLLDVLDLLAQQSPPLVHGLISPEHIIESGMQGNYVLTHFSILLAGDVAQLASGIDRSRLSVYTAPEFARGEIDGRCDLYSLLATAYHAVTGSMPIAADGIIPSAQRLNPNVSPQFEAILTKGLRPLAEQRYQYPTEVRQALLSIRSVSGSVAPHSYRVDRSTSTRRPDTSAMAAQNGTPVVPMAEGVSQILPNMMASAVIDNGVEYDPQVLMPAIDELPPLEARNDTLMAALWIAGILIALLLLVVIGRGLV